MITSLAQFVNLDKSSIEGLNAELEYLRDTLEVLRATDEISNDAFLEAGSIQGGLSLIINLLSQGITGEEAHSQMNSLRGRAESLNQSYPGLDDKIESKR